MEGRLRLGAARAKNPLDFAKGEVNVVTDWSLLSLFGQRQFPTPLAALLAKAFSGGFVQSLWPFGPTPPVGKAANGMNAPGPRRRRCRQCREIYRQHFSYSNPVNKKIYQQLSVYFGGGSTTLSEIIPLKFFEIFAAEWLIPKGAGLAKGCLLVPAGVLCKPAPRPLCFAFGGEGGAP